MTTKPKDTEPSAYPLVAPLTVQPPAFYDLQLLPDRRVLLRGGSELVFLKSG